MKVTYKTPQGALAVTVELKTCGWSGSGGGDQWEEACCIRCGKSLLSSNALPALFRSVPRRLDIGPRLFLAVVEHEVDCAFPKVVVVVEGESWQDREKRLGFERAAGCTCLCRDDGSRDLSLGCPVHK